MRSLTSTVGSGKYRVCSFGDWPVRYALSLDATRLGLVVPEALTNNFVNVLELHFDQNPTGPHVSDINELLRVHELEPIASQQQELRAKSNGASLVRVLNRMIRTYRTYAGYSGAGYQATYNESTQESKVEFKRDRSRSRSPKNNYSSCKLPSEILIRFIKNKQDVEIWHRL